MTDVQIDTKDRGLLSDKADRENVKMRNALRKSSIKSGIKERKKNFFKQFMDQLSEDMVIEPLKKYQELSATQLRDTIADIS